MEAMGFLAMSYWHFGRSQKRHQDHHDYEQTSLVEHHEDRCRRMGGQVYDLSPVPPDDTETGNGSSHSSRR